jgi:hypothetical protein
MAARIGRRAARRPVWTPALLMLALLAAGCGRSDPPAKSGAAMRSEARQASGAIASSLVGHLGSRILSQGGSYQPCVHSSTRHFYSSVATLTAEAGTSVARYQGQIVPELRRLGWTVTIVDVAKLHTFGGPVRHPIDRIRHGDLFGAVNVLDIGNKTETILFVNTNCFKAAKSA